MSHCRNLMEAATPNVVSEALLIQLLVLVVAVFGYVLILSFRVLNAYGPALYV